MRTDMYKEKISDKKLKANCITKDQINRELTAKGFPAIYIETDLDFELSNGVVRLQDDNISLTGLTLAELVKRLRDNNIDAYITRDSIAMLPAELLIDIYRTVYVVEDVDISPKSMSEIHHKNLLNVPGSMESSIERRIVSLYSKKKKIKYKTDGSQFSYSLEGDKLYTNGLLPDTVVSVEYSMNKFFIYLSDENIIELSRLFKHGTNNINRRIMINNVNSNNWDKI
ncbi:MAG: hypothetical protein DRQ78_00775 [Epsilonproteobacteria bacterium]|nr:MAG: hypothetical protein DRQ78_00775 [Campylobacterota bacterium]